MRIGVIDSGIGGLTLLSRLTKAFSGNEFVYFADVSNAPYGDKSREFIIERVRVICRELLAKNIDILVLACNTASVTALDVLKSEFDVPIFGVKPIITGDSDIVLCTPLTGKSQCINSARDRGCVIIEEPTLATEIESVAPYFCALQARIRDILYQHTKGVVHLACTHYVFLKDVIKEIFPDIEIKDGYDSVVNSLSQYVKSHNDRGFLVEFMLGNTKLGLKYSRIFNELGKI